MRTLLLHGFAGSPRTLARFLPDAEAPDLPGHGGAADATSWNDALAALEPADAVRVVGYSMGARLALGLALRHPATVSELVLESGTAGIEDAGAWEYRQRMSVEILIERASITIQLEGEIIKAFDAIIERARASIVLGSGQYVFGHL